MRGLNAPHSPQHLLLSVAWIWGITVSIQWFHIVLICTSMMTYYVRHMFTCLFSIWVPSLVKCFMIFGSLFSYWWVLRVFVHFGKEFLSGVSFGHVFSQSCLLILLILFFTEKFLILTKSKLSIYLSWIVLSMLYLKRHHHTQDHLDFLLCYLSGVLQCCVL